MTKRVALVTGGIGGLGTAMCRALAGAGHTVIANYPPALEAEAAQWQTAQRDTGCEIAVAPGDVTDFDDCAAMCKDLAADFGAVDILINNAGITRDGVFKKMSREHWDAVLETNLSGMFNMSRQVIDGMLGRGWGRIINISSVNGQKGQFGQANYSAAKAGVHGLTMALAQETARKGVTVNSISPGYIATDMVMAIGKDVRAQIVEQIPVGRLGRPEEVAHVVLFLVDELAAYVTGANISVNGGMWMH